MLGANLDKGDMKKTVIKCRFVERKPWMCGIILKDGEESSHLFWVFSYFSGRHLINLSPGYVTPLKSVHVGQQNE